MFVVSCIVIVLLSFLFMAVMDVIYERHIRAKIEKEKSIHTKKLKDLDEQLNKVIEQLIIQQLSQTLYPPTVSTSLKKFGFETNSRIKFEDIRTKYISLIKSSHPDIESSGEDKAKLINQHYTVLKNNRKLFL